MISAQSRQSIDFIFSKSARKSLVLNPDDVCVIEPIKGGHCHGIEDMEMVVLTISSLLFRIVTIFHIAEDTETRDYFLGTTTDKAMLECFAEIGNLCSGAMNQELLKHFTHLGMSTPYKLSGSCLPFLDQLKHGHLSRHAITINASVRLYATVCMCGYAPVDFVADQTEIEDTSGELEFF